MRLCLIGPLPPPSGGMANQTRQLNRVLTEEGVQVELVQVNPPYWPVWVRRVRGLRALFRLPPYLVALWRALGRCDVAHLMANSRGSWFLFAMPAILLARLRRTPIVVNYRGGGAEVFLERWASVVRPVIEMAAACVVPSGFLQQVFARFGIRSEVVPNVVDLTRFSPAAEQDRPTVPHLIVTRNLEPIYDNATALRAFALVRREFPEARMTIAGEGPERAGLQALAVELGLSEFVTFAGRIDNAAIPALYRSASVLLNPSVVDNMPNSILEALASGVPVVSTNVGGVNFIVEDGRTALLVPPRHPEAMAAAVLRLLRDHRLAATITFAGLQEVTRYDWPSVRSRLLDVYRSAAVMRPVKRLSDAA